VASQPDATASQEASAHSVQKPLLARRKHREGSGSLWLAIEMQCRKPKALNWYSGLCILII